MGQAARRPRPHRPHLVPSPEVRRQVARIRREVLDRAVGQLSHNATAAANQIARLASEAESEAVKLQAAAPSWPT